MSASARSERFLARVRDGFVIGDGGYGIALRAAGVVSGNPMLANLDAPDHVLALHRAFVAAGADVIQPNTLVGTRIGLKREGLSDRFVALNQAGAALARRAADESGREVFVGASIGPTGELVEPYGDLPVARAREAFAEQAQVLADAGVDLLIVETFISLEEARAAVEGARAAGLPLIASMAFEPNGRTSFGVTPGQAATALAESGADVVGANCGCGPVELEPVARAFRNATRLPVIIQPNAGMPELREGRTVYPTAPETMAEYAARFRDIGINYIGACCGATPEHIRAMAQRLRG